MTKLTKNDVNSKDLENIIKQISFPENPLIEKLNMLLLKRGYETSSICKMMKAYLKNESSDEAEKYKNLYEKNKVALLFQLISDYPPTQKKYVGFEMFTRLSSGIIRTFLELCYNAFNESIFEDQDSLSQGKEIPWKIQQRAVDKKSKNFFADIQLIPFSLGQSISEFIENIGVILRTLHLDERISEPEPTYFSTDTANLADKTNKIIDSALRWSILQKEYSMEPKSSTEKHLTDFVLNRILIPKFNISYRKRGRTIIHPKFVDILAFGTEEEKKTIRQKVAKEGPDCLSQKTLHDF